jgi:hypothetical protein
LLRDLPDGTHVLIFLWSDDNLWVHALSLAVRPNVSRLRAWRAFSGESHFSPVLATHRTVADCSQESNSPPGAVTGGGCRRDPPSITDSRGYAQPGARNHSATGNARGHKSVPSQGPERHVAIRTVSGYARGPRVSTHSGSFDLPRPAPAVQRVCRGGVPDGADLRSAPTHCEAETCRSELARRLRTV